VREADGLALSSRNRYLDPDQRQRATALVEALRAAEARIAAGERQAAVVREAVVRRIEATPSAALDYAAVVDADSLDAVDPLHGNILVALAVRFGATRLIDNVLVSVPPSP